PLDRCSHTMRTSARVEAAMGGPHFPAPVRRLGPRSTVGSSGSSCPVTGALCGRCSVPAVCKRSKGRCPGIGVIHSTHKLRTPRTMSAVPRPPRRPAKRGPPSRGARPKFWAPSRNFCPTSTYLDHQLRDVRLDVREEARSDVIAPLLIFAQKLPHI